MSARELTCRELIDFLRAYLDGELETPVRSRFESHLEACPDCADYLASYRRTIERAAAVRDPCELGDGIPADVPERLVQAVLAARRRP